MPDLQTIQASLEEELIDYLRKLSDPKVKHLLAALDHIKNARTTVKINPSHVKPDGQPVMPDTPLTRGDACVEAIQEAKRPLHVEDLVDYVINCGFQTTRERLVGILKRDALNRFINKGGNVYTLNEEALAASKREYFQSTPGGPIRRRKKFKIADLGVTLKQAVLMEIAKFGDQEFDQPTILKLLHERFPKSAVSIQKTTVAVTLNNLAKDGVIETTFGGWGAKPKRYRNKLQSVEREPQGTLLSIRGANNNELEKAG